jgi:HAD superfamily hydrolase (TIGR01509 family)
VIGDDAQKLFGASRGHGIAPLSCEHPPVVDAVVFDMDGVLVDSEVLWDAAREAVALELGGRWSDRAQRDMMGMSSREWSGYMHQELGVPLEPERINDEVVARMEGLYRQRLPLISGAREAVERLAEPWPLGIASSANRPLIELALELAGLSHRFEAIVSSEEVPRGKPAPDVYLEAARRLDMAPERCAAIEDSANGILAARAAGMRAIAIPNRAFPPGQDALARADVVLDSVTELDPAVVAGRNSGQKNG